jgi:hypothetical protein
MTKLLIGNVADGLLRFGFLAVFAARKSAKFPANPPRFTAVAILPKNHPQVQRIRAAVKEAAETGWPDAKKRPKLSDPLRDGSTDKPGNPAYAGMYFFTANAQEGYPPGVVTGQAAANGLEPAKEQDWNAGDYGRVSVDVFPSVAYGKLCFGLNNVQFLRKGEPLTNKESASSEFGVEAVDPDETF